MVSFRQNLFVSQFQKLTGRQAGLSRSALYKSPHLPTGYCLLIQRRVYYPLKIYSLNMSGTPLAQGGAGLTGN